MARDGRAGDAVTTEDARQAQLVLHGTSAGYTYGCRCIDCKDARLAAKLDWNRRNFAKTQAHSATTRTAHQRGTAGAAHGTRGRYVEGCRCEDCAQANRDYQRAYMAQRRRSA